MHASHRYISHQSHPIQPSHTAPARRNPDPTPAGRTSAAPPSTHHPLVQIPPCNSDDARAPESLPTCTGETARRLRVMPAPQIGAIPRSPTLREIGTSSGIRLPCDRSTNDCQECKQTKTTTAEVGFWKIPKYLSNRSDVARFAFKQYTSPNSCFAAL